MAVATHEPELAPRVEPAPVVLGQALAGIAGLGHVAASPKVLEPLGARARGGEAVERRDLVRATDHAQVGAVQGEGLGRARRVGPGEVGAPALRRAIHEVIGARQLEQAEARVGARRERGPEGRERGVGVADLPFHAPARELQPGIPTGGRRRREPHRLQRDVEPGLDALGERGARQIDRRLRECRVGLHRARERTGGLGHVVLSELLPDVLDRDGRGLALREFSEAQAVPRVGPIGRELAGPLELARSVVIMTLGAGDLAEPVGEEPEPQMDQRVVPVPLRQLDPRGLEALQGDRVAHPRERVAQRLERRPVRRRLGGEAIRDGGAEREQQGERGAHGGIHYTPRRNPSSGRRLRSRTRTRSTHWRAAQRRTGEPRGAPPGRAAAAGAGCTSR